jgi:hypothetical protein
MIVFDLQCGAGHQFEGWFGSGKEFKAQKKRGLVTCPSCGTAEVERVLSVPRINVGAQAPQVPAKTPEMEGKDPFAIAQMLYSRMLDEIFTKTEDVGSKFPEEARKIYYQEAPWRAIRGQASKDEHDALVEEGIPVARIPVPSNDQLN